MLPFGRRGFLASAAVAAALPLAAATDADADTVQSPPGPEQEPGPAAGCGAVPRLMAVPEHRRDVDWIRESLQIAVQLELATIPPYLCGWWSIHDRTSQAARLIRRVVADEMYHLGVVSNLLVAVGGRPRIMDAAMSYPGQLPGGVRAGVTVYLSGLTKSLVHDVMMAIEAPDQPLARADAASGIGDFYDAVLAAFRRARPELSAEGQLAKHIGSDVLKPVASLDDVEHAIGIVKEQGEGTTSSPADAFGDDQPAHYYAFGEIYHERRLQRVGHRWEFSGQAIPFPSTRPMAAVPAGGWPGPSPAVRRLLGRFDGTYHAVLHHLESAWSEGDPRALNAAVHAMHGLEGPAVELMETTRPDGPGSYGPQFRPPAARNTV
ncbi:ferritin-like protein [Streptomyces sp. NPDC047028]|uniref:ferritin-like domain-containing protein n=1 Tax=Streptomyces sp. NPDC047028 TaxID=3155793 RepID=UPI0034002903